MFGLVSILLSIFASTLLRDIGLQIPFLEMFGWHQGNPGLTQELESFPLLLSGKHCTEAV